MSVYLSPKAVFADFDQPSALVWRETGIVYGDLNEKRHHHHVVPMTEVCPQGDRCAPCSP